MYPLSSYLTFQISISTKGRQIVIVVRFIVLRLEDDKDIVVEIAVYTFIEESLRLSILDFDSSISLDLCSTSQQLQLRKTFKIQFRSLKSRKGAAGIMSAEENPWALETSQRKATTDWGNTEQSKKESASAVFERVPQGHGPSNMADPRGNTGLVPPQTKVKDGRLTEESMQEADRAYRELFFGITASQETINAGEPTAKKAAKGIEAANRKRALKDASNHELQRVYRLL